MEGVQVVCVLPTSKKDRYDQIKRCCLVDLPIPSQCVVAKYVLIRASHDIAHH
jgi:hypothetical protein